MNFVIITTDSQNKFMIGAFGNPKVGSPEDSSGLKSILWNYGKTRWRFEYPPMVLQYRFP